MSSNATLVWFRQDLRLKDNLALTQAAERGGPVIPVYIWAPKEEGEWSIGVASQWWLKRSLAGLDQQLKKIGSRLIIRQGPTVQTLSELVAQTGAGAVHWNRRYEPESVLQDSQIESALGELGIEVVTFNSALLFEPWEVAKDDGSPYQVFTSFWKRCLSLGKSVELSPAPRALNCPQTWPESTSSNWTAGVPDTAKGFKLDDIWTPGAEGAKSRMQDFFKYGLMQYDSERDRPDLSRTSSLSPHLHFGEIGPRQIWRALQDEVLQEGDIEDLKGPTAFVNELGWREFAYHLLYHFPQTVDRPLRSEFDRYPWRSDPELYQAWQDGQTGYPLVDAGMRQLRAIGWVHNRVRMVVASFLVKHLLMPWQDGAGWFWDTLVDADLANNTLGWQWVAGCGADAAPYFRIFNPVSQGEKFDPQGAYVRRWVPELAGMPDNWIHRPWEAPQKTLDRAGIRIDREYPSPIVDHKFARQRALEAFETVKQNRRTLASSQGGQDR